MNFLSLTQYRNIISINVIVFILAACGQQTGNEPEKVQVVRDNLTDTLAMLNTAVQSNPTLVGPYLERAAYFVKKDMFNEAFQDVNTALTINENDPEVYSTLSDIYLYSGKMQKALDALKKAKEIAPDAAIYDVKMATLYLTMSDYKQTFNALRDALKKDPENAQAFFVSGLAHEEMGDTAQAINAYQMTVARDQKHYNALKQLGILFSIKKDKLAIDYLRNAATIRPGAPEPLYILGMFYQENGEPDKALGVYEELIILKPQYKLAYYNKGYVYLVYKQDYTEAISSFSKAIAIDEDYADAWYNRGYAYELQGNLELARSNYSKVLRLRVNDEKTISALNRLDTK